MRGRAITSSNGEPRSMSLQSCARFATNSIFSMITRSPQRQRHSQRKGLRQLHSPTADAGDLGHHVQTTFLSCDSQSSFQNGGSDFGNASKGAIASIDASLFVHAHTVCSTATRDPAFKNETMGSLAFLVLRPLTPMRTAFTASCIVGT
jgi:hypothetical protein